MLRILRITLVVIAIAGVLPTAETPALTLGIADGSRVVSAWETSLYGKLWQDPALAGLRDLATRWLDDVEQRSGVAPVALLRGARDVRLRLDHLQRDADGQVQAQGVLRADLGQEAQRVHAALLAASPGILATLTGNVVGLLSADALTSPVGQPTLTAPAEAMPPPLLRATVDSDVLLALLQEVAPAAQQIGFASLRETFAHYMGEVDYEFHLTETGGLEWLRFPVAPHSPRPLDRAVLARLPGNTLAMLAQGVDGGTMWRAERENLLRDLAEDYGTDGADDTEIAVDESLKELGMRHGIAEVINGLDGTIVIALTPGAPMPGFSVIVPRSVALDDLVHAACVALEVEMPAEGLAVTVTIPGIPYPVQLVRDAGFWVTTTDSGLAVTWGDGKPGGWAESAAGQLALAKARPEAFLIGASDTPAVLRLLAGMIATRINQVKTLTPSEKRAVVQGLAAAAPLAGTGYLVGHGVTSGETGSTVLEARGVLGLGFCAGAFAYLAVKPSLDPQADNETAAVDTLINEIGPGEDEFQENLHLDQDGDGTGEYGLLPELAGRPLTADGSKTDILPPRFADHAVIQRGYHFALHLPDGKGGALTASATPRTLPVPFAAAQAQAQFYVVYAWPDQPKHGRRMFAMTQDGDLYVAPFTGAAPAWNALFGGDDKRWDDDPAWDVYEE